MPIEKPPTDVKDGPMSKEEFDAKDEALTKALDKLEREALPPKPKPAPVGGMF